MVVKPFFLAETRADILRLKQEVENKRVEAGRAIRSLRETTGSRLAGCLDQFHLDELIAHGSSVTRVYYGQQRSLKNVEEFRHEIAWLSRNLEDQIRIDVINERVEEGREHWASFSLTLVERESSAPTVLKILRSG